MQLPPSQPEGMDPARAEARFWDQLLQYIGERRVIPLLGRDLLEVETNGRRTSLYRLLAERLADYLEVEKDQLPAGAELNEVAVRYMDGPGRRAPEDIYSGLKSVASDLDDLQLPEALVKLAEIRPLQLFVSTTFDPFLGRALNQVRFGGREKTRILAYSPTSDSDLDGDLNSLSGPTVFHLLGQLSAVGDYAVTEEDTLEFVHSLQGRRPNLLFDELAKHQLMVIGCSYPDWLTRFFIRVASGDRLSAARSQIFLADATVREDSDLERFLEHFGACTRIFSSGGPLEFVTELHRRWTDLHPPGEPVDEETEERAEALDAMERGAVFLSYARDDLDKARAIKEELERVGLDVWFDFKDLESGDRFEQKIRDNIEQCSVFLALLSQHTTTRTRGFFRLEWDYATQESKFRAANVRFLVPVIIDDVTSPTDKSLPAEFRAVNCVSLPDGRPTAEFVGQLREVFRDYHKRQQGGTL